MAPDPVPPQRRLLEGETVLAFFRRKRLENVLMLPFTLGVALFLLGTFLQWRRPLVMGLFALVFLLAVPIGIAVNTRWWLTDRSVLRSVVGVWTEFPIERVAAARVTKGRLGDDVRFEDAEGNPVVVVTSVDNAADILQAHAGLKAAAPAEAETPAAAPEGPASESA